MENAGPFLVFLFLFLVGGAVGLSLAFRRTMGDGDRASRLDAVADRLQEFSRLRESSDGSSEKGSSEETVAEWQQMADALGVELHGDDPATGLRVRGDVDGVEIEVRRVSDEHDNPRVVYEADVSGIVPETFGMEAQNTSDAFDGLGVSNRDDIYVGDPELDSEFTFHGRGEDAIRQFVWQEGVEETLRELSEFPSGTAITDGRFESSEWGALPSAEHGARMVREIVGFIERLRTAGEEDAPERTEGDDNEGWEAPS